METGTIVFLIATTIAYIIFEITLIICLRRDYDDDISFGEFAGTNLIILIFSMIIGLMINSIYKIVNNWEENARAVITIITIIMIVVTVVTTKIVLYRLTKTGKKRPKKKKKRK